MQVGPARGGGRRRGDGRGGAGIQATTPRSTNGVRTFALPAVCRIQSVLLQYYRGKILRGTRPMQCASERVAHLQNHHNRTPMWLCRQKLIHNLGKDGTSHAPLHLANPLHLLPLGPDQPDLRLNIKSASLKSVATFRLSLSKILIRLAIRRMRENVRRARLSPREVMWCLQCPR